MKIARIQIPARHESIHLDPEARGRGLILRIGTTHLHLDPTTALKLANSIADTIETQAAVIACVHEGAQE